MGIAHSIRAHPLKGDWISNNEESNRMKIEFRILDRKDSVPEGIPNVVFLKIDFWNDYSFVTMFSVYAFDNNAIPLNMPSVKIGFYGQTTEVSTYSSLERVFDRLPDGYFSLGTDVEYYRILVKQTSMEWRSEFLKRLNDVASNTDILNLAIREDVFKISHLRGVSINAVKNQFPIILSGDVPSTDFHFHFLLPKSKMFAGYDLEFKVIADSEPSTNIHALIGRNGVGKTTLLNHIVRAISQNEDNIARLYKKTISLKEIEIGKEFFSNLRA